MFGWENSEQKIQSDAIRETQIYPWDIGRKVMVGNDNDHTLFCYNARWMELHVMFTKKRFQSKLLQEILHTQIRMIKNISYKLLDPQFNNTKDYVYGIIFLLSEITIVAKIEII